MVPKIWIENDKCKTKKLVKKWKIKKEVNQN